jgi:hypothetical protein
MSAADKAKLDGLSTFVNAGTVTTNYTPDAAAADVYEITLGAATVTINAPTNPTNGRKVLYRLKQDATGNRAADLERRVRGGNRRRYAGALNGGGQGRLRRHGVRRDAAEVGFHRHGSRLLGDFYELECKRHGNGPHEKRR